MEIRKTRIFSGKNIFSHYPAVEMEVDLGVHAQKRTSNIPGFTDRLLAILPGLGQHHCSRGRPGGFAERLKEGTYLGHVIEHVALELQASAGSRVIYGRTRRVTPGVYQVVFEYEVREAALLAAEHAVELVWAVVEGTTPDSDRALEQIRRATARAALGPSTRAVVEAAARRGIPHIRLNQSSLIQLGYGAAGRRVQATLTCQTSCIGVDIASDKVLTKDMLAGAGIPVPPGDVVTGEKEAVEAWRELGGSVAVKPVDGNQGKGVTLNLSREEEVLAAYRLARHYADRVMVEKYVPGRHYRLLVVDGRMVAAAERIPAHVVGDGRHTIAELVDITNTDPARGDGHEQPLTKIRIDPVVLMNLARRNLTLNYVPSVREAVFVRDNGNLSTGGTACDVTDRVHPQVGQLAVRAAEIIGLDVAGVDMVAADITGAAPPDSWPGSVIEVNASPGLRMHLHPSEGKSRDVGKIIVDYLFPPGQTGRIPVVAVTGTNGKTTTTRLIAHLLSRTGLTVGMATTDGVYVGDRLLVEGDTTGPGSARTILMDKRAQAAVLETARGGLIRGGLAYDHADVSVVTNISLDHLGQDGIETISDLTRVKSLVVESTSPRGWAVLNARDPLVVPMADSCPGRVAFFSSEDNNLQVKKTLSRGGQAAFVDGGSIVLGCGSKTISLLKIDDVPMVQRGLAQHNLENALAGCLSAWLLGVKPAALARGLLTFDGHLQNPGRFSLFRFGPAQVLVDYGHNLHGYRAVLSAARHMTGRRLVGVIGVPGDRRDRDITATARVAGEHVDYAYVKEDSDLRGRRPGEVADLLTLGLIQSGLGEEDMELVLDEAEATYRAALSLSGDDMLVVFHEKLGRVMDALRSAAEDKGWELEPATAGPPPVETHRQQHARTGKPTRGVE